MLFQSRRLTTSFSTKVLKFKIAFKLKDNIFINSVKVIGFERQCVTGIFICKKLLLVLAYV